jgi:hypothetical protein
MHEIARAEAIAALKAQYGVISDIVGSLTREELLEPSGCLGWNNADLVFHMLLDAQRALVAFNSPAAPPADKDFVTYWEGFQASDDTSRVHERFVRISTAAHRDSKMICSRWIETSSAAIRASGTSDTEVVTTQGHVLTLGNFIATLVVEAAIHHLDLTWNLGEKPGPAPSALSVTTATLDGLLKQARPAQWSDTTYVLKATGRQALSSDERSILGAAHERIPLFS